MYSKLTILVLGMILPISGMAKEIHGDTKSEMLPEWFEDYQPQVWHCVVHVDDEGSVWYQDECQDERLYTIYPKMLNCQEQDDSGTMLCIGEADPKHTEGYAEVYSGTELCIDPGTESLPLFKDENGITDQCSIANHGEYHEYIMPEEDEQYY